jgi:hypothetical protein
VDQQRMNIFRIVVVAAMLPVLCAAAVNPPAQRYRSVTRYFRDGPAFPLIQNSRPAFRLVISDPGNPILDTAAGDLRRYFAERWGSGPQIASSLSVSENVIVLLTAGAAPTMPPSIAAQLRDLPALAPEGFLVRNLQDGKRRVIACIGGSPVGARYAAIELLRRAQAIPGGSQVSLSEWRDEPYSSYRAVYINDSAHQINNYSPNLIHPVATFRWSKGDWERYLDELAFFRYNVLMIWIVPQMFAPAALHGGGQFDYFRDTMRDVAHYAQPRGIRLSLLNGVNVSVKAGTRMDTIPRFSRLPEYTYLNPLKPDEHKLMLSLWDYWSKAIPEVDIWELFPGDPGGCHEEGCGPETYVDIGIELSQIIKRNNPKAQIDFCAWHFFGWGPTWPTQFRSDTKRVDRGYEYLVSKVDAFPPDSIFSSNVNDVTSFPPVAQAPLLGGSAIPYIEKIAAKRPVHTWAYTVTEGEGLINHHYKVPGILRARDLESRYPLSGGLCYTMTPSLNVLNQFACAEGFWNPAITQAEVMKSYTEGVFGKSDPAFTEIFPWFDIAPVVGYTFHNAATWTADYASILQHMTRAAEVLGALKVPDHARFPVYPAPRAYASELQYWANLYRRLSLVGADIARAKDILKSSGVAEPWTRTAAQAHLRDLPAGERARLQALLESIDRAGMPTMKRAYQQKHYQLFLDYPTEFTPLLPGLIDGFFRAFGGDFVN